MLKLSDFFAPLGLGNLSIFIAFLVCCEIIGFSFAKIFIKKIPNFLRGAIWLLGLGLVVFLYFLSHFFIPYAWPAIGICLAILLIPSLPVYLRKKGWQSLIEFWKGNYLPLLLLLPVIPLIFIKTSLPPYIWDEMAYHYISPFTLYHEQSWRVGIGLYENLPRFLETAYIALFSLTRTYATARLLHFSIFITALLTIYKFLKENFGQIPALLFFALLAYHGENLLFRATSGYIDVGTTSLVIIGIICLVNFFLENKLEVLVISAAFWGMAAGAKYSALIPMAAYFLAIFVLIFKRRLFKRKYLRSYLLVVLLFLVMGGYWYIKNFIYVGNPIYPFLFGCKIARCTKEAFFGVFTTPFVLSNAKRIAFTVLAEDKNLVYLFLLSIPLSLLHLRKKVSKLVPFLLLILGIEILIARQLTGYEPRYFYHWQFLTILLIVLPATSIANLIKKPKKFLSIFRSLLDINLRIGKREKIWWLEMGQAKIFFRICSFSFPPLWVLAFLFSLAESFTYSGFLPGTKFLILLAVLSGILARITDSENKTFKLSLELRKSLFKLNGIFFLPFLIVGIMINFFELVNYHNYVFSTLHVQPQLFPWPIFMSGFLFFLDPSLPKRKWFQNVFLRMKKLSKGQEQFNQRQVLSLLFTVLVLIFTACRATSFVYDYYKDERQAERETEVRYALRKIDIYLWTGRLFPRMKEVIFWCEDQEPETDLIALNPGIIWYEYEGLLRIFMTNCNIKHGEIVNLPAEEVVDSLKEERKSLLIVSLNGCKKEIKSTKMRRSEDEVEYLRQVNNDIICNSEKVLPGLYRFSVSD